VRTNIEKYLIHIPNPIFMPHLCQNARHAIAKAKQRSQRPVIGRVTKMYYVKLLRALEGTLSGWSRLHLQSFVPTPVSRMIDERQAAGRKNNCRIFVMMITL
jgi:hypothetical protein